MSIRTTPRPWRGFAHLVFAVAGAACMISSAIAQKVADTVRIAVIDPVSTTLYYDDQKPEMPFFTASIYDTLMCYDRKKREFTPLLAKSWKVVSPTVFEFELRDDIKFHNGDAFSANDVVYTLNWAINPESKLRFAPNEYQLGWIDKAEKTGPYSVRITAKQPMPLAMVRLSTSSPIVNSKVHAALADKSDYGRKTPYGTGPYRVANFDPLTGVKLARYEDYKHGSTCKPAATIGKAEIIPLPEVQTQIAQLFAGGVDFMRVQTKDMEDAFAANPDVAMSAVRDFGIMHFMMDAADRTKLGIWSKQKVREAATMALNRESIARAVMPGGKEIYGVEALCVSDELGCDWSRKLPEYNLQKAKALLAEAGYPNGFETEISALPSAYELADAVAGELRKIGIRASVDKQTFAAFRRKQADNKLHALVAFIPSQATLDASSTVSYYFAGGVRDYSGDARMQELNSAGLRETDIEKRKVIYKEMNDRNNELLHVVPLVANPAVYAHTKVLKVNKDMVHPEGFTLHDLSWN